MHSFLLKLEDRKLQSIQTKFYEKEFQLELTQGETYLLLSNPAPGGQIVPQGPTRIDPALPQRCCSKSISN